MSFVILINLPVTPLCKLCLFAICLFGCFFSKKQNIAKILEIRNTVHLFLQFKFFYCFVFWHIHFNKTCEWSFTLSKCVICQYNRQRSNYKDWGHTGRLKYGARRSRWGRCSLGVDLEKKTQTPFIPYRIPTGVPMRVGFGICQGRRLCRAQIWGPEVKVREVLSGRGLREKTQTPFIPHRIPTGVPMRVGFGICQGRRLCRLRDDNGWRA